MPVKTTILVLVADAYYVAYDSIYTAIGNATFWGAYRRLKDLHRE
jgi:hypothetical protein